MDMSPMNWRVLAAAIFLAADEVCESLFYAYQPKDDDSDYQKLSIEDAVARAAKLEKAIINYREPRT